jgi:hypothetical protein
MALTVLNKIGTASILDNAITSGKIIDNAITSGKIIDNAITSGKIIDNAITSGKIINNAVTSSKIVAGAAGKVLQVVTATTTTAVSSTSTTYIDSGLTANITPSSTSSRIMIMVTHSTRVYAVDGVAMGLKLLRGSTNIYENPRWRYQGVQHNTNIMATQSMHSVDSPSSTSALTYKTQFARTSSAGSPTQAELQPESTKSIITLIEVAG